MAQESSFINQMEREVRLLSPPKRIISLVPSQTELLFDLGLEEKVVGITKFCIHPNKWYKSKTRVGGTKNVNFKKIDELNPDLIIANKEENTKEEIEQLSKKYNVWISDIITYKDSIKMIEQIGAITNTEKRAKEIVSEINLNFEKLHIKLSDFSLKKTIYLIWKDPIISVGGNTFINEMLNQNKLKNSVINNDRYPELSESDLIKLNPEVLLLSSEPFPFKEKHIHYFQQILTQSKVVLVDGEMFSWYGSRLIKAPEYFIKLAHDLRS